MEQLVDVGQDRLILNGVVRLDGREIPFVLGWDDVERRGLFRCLREYLLRSGDGLLTYSPSWNSRALDVALLLHSPDRVKGTQRIGWNRGQNRLNFRNFAIHARGRVLIGDGALILGDGHPAQNLRAPEGFFAFELEELSRRALDVELFWAMAACVVHNLIAPALCKAQAGIALEVAGAQAIGPAAAALLGCVRMPVPSRRVAEPVTEWLRQTTHAHDFPPILEPAQRPRSTGLKIWLEGWGPKNAVLATDCYTACLLEIQGHWHLLRCAESVRTLHLSAETAWKVIPGYLADACDRQFIFEGESEHLLLTILSDLAGWFEHKGGDPHVLREADRWLQPAGSVSIFDSFGQLLSQLRRDGRLPVVEAGPEMDRQDRLQLVRVPEKDRIWISPQRLNQLLARQGVPELELPTLLPLLAEDGVLLYGPDMAQSRAGRSAASGWSGTGGCRRRWPRDA